MPRANRHFIPGYAWHITHRCHKKEFLLQEACRNRVEGSLRSNKNTKNEQWSESVAVGSEAFIVNTMEKLGIKAKGHEAVEADGRYQLRESVISYKPNFATENSDLRLENTYFWDDIA